MQTGSQLWLDNKIKNIHFTEGFEYMNRTLQSSQCQVES